MASQGRKPGRVCEENDEYGVMVTGSINTDCRSRETVLLVSIFEGCLFLGPVHYTQVEIPISYFTVGELGSLKL